MAVSLKPASVLVLVLKLMCGCVRWITFSFVKKHHRTFFVLFDFREVFPPVFSVSVLYCVSVFLFIPDSYPHALVQHVLI